MICQLTQGVEVSVKSFYEGNFKSNEGNIDVFKYHIVIKNNSEHTIKLLKRHWLIFDAADSNYEVEGNGIVGAQPILRPGDKHSYQSGTQLKAPIGAMKGRYLFKRMIDDEVFFVEIPKFQLIAPFIAN